MTMHAIDTLAAAEMLQEAGLEEKAAKAIVQVFDEGATNTLATKADIEIVRADMSTLGESLRKEIAQSKWQLVVAMGVLLGLFKGFDKFF